MADRQSYRLRYKQPAARDIKKLSPQVRKRLGAKLAFFADQPDPLRFAQRLTKPADAQWRFRVGNYRVLFDVEGRDLVVLHVQHRREAYRK